MNGKQRLQSLLMFNSLSLHALCYYYFLFFYWALRTHAAIIWSFSGVCARFLCYTIAHQVVIVFVLPTILCLLPFKCITFSTFDRGEMITLGVPMSHTGEVSPCITSFGTMKYRRRRFIPTLCMRGSCVRRPSCHVQLNYDAKASPGPGADLSKSSAVKSGGCRAVWGNCFGSCFIFNSKAQAIGLNYSNRHLAVHNILHLFSHAVLLCSVEGIKSSEIHHGTQTKNK